LGYFGLKTNLSSSFSISLLSILIALLSWEFLVRVGIIPALFLPPPSHVILALVEMVYSGELWPHLMASLKRIALGLFFGVSLGWITGIFTGILRPFESALGPILACIYPVPKIAILPLLILYLGLGESPKVCVIAIGVFFPIYINTKTGVKNIDEQLLLAARSLCKNKLSLILKVIIPASLPHFLSGLKLSTGISLLLLVTSEMIAANSGIGYMILRAADLMLTTKLIAGIVILSILGLIFSYAIELMGRLLNIK